MRCSMCLPSLIHPKTSRNVGIKSPKQSLGKTVHALFELPLLRAGRWLAAYPSFPAFPLCFYSRVLLLKGRAPFEKSQSENLPRFPINKREVLSIPGSSPIYLTKVMDILMTLSDYHTVIDSLQLLWWYGNTGKMESLYTCIIFKRITIFLFPIFFPFKRTSNYSNMVHNINLLLHKEEYKENFTFYGHTWH